LASDPSLGMIGQAIAGSYNEGCEHIIVRMSKGASTSTLFLLLSSSGCIAAISASVALRLRPTVARKILPFSQFPAIETDEYLFALAPTLADSVIRTELLTHYYIHGANLFMRSVRKRRAPSLRASPDAAAAVLELVVEAAQLGLQLRGRIPLETYCAERTLYRIQHQALPDSARSL